MYIGVFSSCSSYRTLLYISTYMLSTYAYLSSNQLFFLHFCTSNNKQHSITISFLKYLEHLINFGTPFHFFFFLFYYQSQYYYSVLLNSFLKQDECHVCPRCDISFSLSLKWGVKNCTFRIVLNHFFFQTFRLPQQDPTQYSSHFLRAIFSASST